MALTKITDRPSTAVQLGVGTLGGSPTNVATALADSSDLTYVQVNQRCRLDSEVVRVGFPAVSLPAGARVYSVEIRRRTLEVTPGNPVPVCLHWHRCRPGSILVAGQRPRDHKRLFVTPCPTTTNATATYVEEALGEDRTGPDGAVWDPASNLSSWHVTTNPGGHTYDLGRDDDEVTTFRVSAVYRDIYYQTQAEVTVTAPTGTPTDTRPTVTWTYASAESQPQRSYRVAVYTADQVAAPGFVPFETIPLVASGVQAPTKAESWWLLGEDLSWTLTADLTDGDYVAYVQVTSKWAGAGGEFTTEVASTTWSRVSLPADPPPAAVLTSAVFNTTIRRVEVTFEPGAGNDPAATAFSVQSSRDNGVTWQVAPSLEHVPANGDNAITVYDRLAPLNADSIYRVIAFSQAVLVAAEAPSNEITVHPTGRLHRLVHPTNSLLDIDLPLDMSKTDDGIKVTLRQMMAVYQLIGGEGQEVLPKVVFGPTYGREYDLNSLYAGTDLTELYPALDRLRTATLGFLHPDGTTEWVAIGPGASGRDTEETYTPTPGNPVGVLARRRSYTATQVAAPSIY